MSTTDTGSIGGQTRPRLEISPGLSIFVVLLLIGLVIPSIIQLGPLRLSVYRVVLLLATVPCIYWWLTGRAGRIRLADIAILLAWLWSALSYSILEGVTPMFERNGIYFLETVGTYLMARCFIRNADDFRAMIRVLYWIVILMLPFALYETFTGQPVILNLFGSFTEVPGAIEKEPRLGFYRVQGPFEHQILFGVFCGSILGLTHLVLGYGDSVIVRGGRSFLVFVTAFLSLSSGPVMAQMVQVMLLGWNWMLRNVAAKWKILAGLVGSMTLLIEAVANRSTAELLIHYFAFNSWTAMNRLRIWEYGSANVLNNPLFGLGLDDWARPGWMLASVDMFWLVPAMRNGIPAVAFLLIAWFAILVQAARSQSPDARVTAYRTGYVISMVGIFLAGWTVHYWNATYVLVTFLLGAGAWFGDGGTPRKKLKRRPSLPYSRPRPQTAQEGRA